MDLAGIRRIFSDLGAIKVYGTELAENDNSKNQVYLGKNFQVLNIIPNLGVFPDSSPKETIFKAKLNFSWVNTNGTVSPAPHSKLILYPQYPEVRLSGFLSGCKNAPSELMAHRLRGRVLFLAVSTSGKIFGMVFPESASISAEFKSLNREPDAGVFVDLTCSGADNSREALLRELTRINHAGWIKSKRLDGHGALGPCNARNCGGLTLEAELGVRPNSLAEPDFLGWEVKQHKVSNFNRFTSGIVTLMTPEPIGGFYGEQGAAAFVRKFGYPDRCGREDRLNFGGIHKAGERHPLTGLTLRLIGFDGDKGVIVKDSGGIALVTDSGEISALWPFAGLLTHWVRKHARAAYVPSLTQKEPLSYMYGDKVRLALKTDFLKFLKAMNAGSVYYDPGLKIENLSTRPTVKTRNQFRIKSKEIGALYETVETVQL
ncbi:MAG: MvaI/BcnI family restriction endonuclease [Elusimicrobiales bacterium]